MGCPNCQSDSFVKNGKTYYGEQRFKCKKCGRQFTENSKYKHISSETKDLIDRLLSEKKSLTVIARDTKVSSRWLQNYVNKKYGKKYGKIFPKNQKTKKNKLDIPQGHTKKYTE